MEAVVAVLDGHEYLLAKLLAAAVGRQVDFVCARVHARQVVLVGVGPVPKHDWNLEPVAWQRTQCCAPLKQVEPLVRVECLIRAILKDDLA